MSGWGNIARAYGRKATTHDTLLETLEQHALEYDAELRAKLFRMAAERVQTRTLSESEARTISRWLWLMSKGKDPIPEKTGRKRTDDRNIDIAWACKTRIDRNMELSEVWEEVARGFGLKPKSIKNIYSAWKKRIN